MELSSITVMEALKTDTKFMYHQGLEIKFKDGTRGTSKSNLQMMKINEELTLDDAFILNTIYLLEHATIDMILRCLNIQKDHYPEKAYPHKTFKPLKRRLETLAKRGLVTISDYIVGRNVIDIYTCTLYGYIYFSNTLDMSYMPFDINVVFHAEVESFKRMAAASIAMAMAQKKECLSLDIANTTLFGDSFKFDMFTYGKVLMNYQGQQVLYVIEPLYFSVNNAVISNEEALLKTSKRLDNLLNKIEKKELESGMIIIPVFCIENLDGTLKLAKLLKEVGISERYNHSLYTSENALFCSQNNMEKLFIQATFSPAENGQINIHVKPIPKWEKFR